MKRFALVLMFLSLVAAAAVASNRITEETDPDQSARNKVMKRAPAAGPVTLSPAEADSLTKKLTKERADTQDWLKSAPNSYLAAVARRDFGNQTTLIVGSGAQCDVHIADSTVAERALAVTVEGDSFRVEAIVPNGSFNVKGADLRYAIVGPGAVGLGRFTLRLSHQRYPAIIVFDPKSPRYAEYKGLQWFDPNLAYRFVLSLTPNPEPDTIEILSTHSQARRALRAGWFVFKLDGKRCVLEATRLIEPGVGENDVSVFFRDETTGKESYSVGRYLDVEKLPDGHYVLDFNEAYNPACAVSKYYNCPIPSKSNTLKVAVHAGEKDPHYAH